MLLSIGCPMNGNSVLVLIDFLMRNKLFVNRFSIIGVFFLGRQRQRQQPSPVTASKEQSHFYVYQQNKILFFGCFSFLLRIHVSWMPLPSPDDRQLYSTVSHFLAEEQHSCLLLGVGCTTHTNALCGLPMDNDVYLGFCLQIRIDSRHFRPVWTYFSYGEEGDIVYEYCSI